MVLLALYAAWVGYDIAWTFALWQRNRDRGHHKQEDRGEPARGPKAR